MRMTPEEKYQEVKGWFEVKEEHADYFMAFCPGHSNTDTPALSVKKYDDGVGLNCFAGCSTEEILTPVGKRPADLFVEPPKGTKSAGKLRTRTANAPGCTLPEYASAKQLPEDQLREKFGLSELTRHPKTGAPAVRMPYRGEDRTTLRERYRIALHKGEADNRFLWRSGSKADMLYGLERLPEIRQNGRYVILAEGESDCHTGVCEGFPVLGIPGAKHWKSLQSASFEGIERVYLIRESGEAGAMLAEKAGEMLGQDGRDLLIVDLPDEHDISSLYLEDSRKFKERFQAALDAATLFSEEQEEEDQQRARELWAECEELATKPDILEEFKRDVGRVVVGQDREAQIVYLASVTRFLCRPTSVVVKGPSGGGKTYVTMQSLAFRPPEAIYSISAMSPKTMAYDDEPMSYKHLVIYEATALEEDEMLAYLVRTLLSEGHIRYKFVDTGGEGSPEVKTLEREGPTGLFVTTTSDSLHPENETRMLSLYVNDSKAQTLAINRTTARKRRSRHRHEQGAGGPDLSRWHTLSRWITLAGIKVADIPYAEWLADEIPPAAVRLRRDFEQVLNLCEAHAILHQANREINEWGEIVASVEDYRAVRALLADLLSEQLESSVPSIVRETVEKLAELIQEKKDDEEEEKSISGVELGKALSVDKAAINGRIKKAQNRGFVKNLNAGKRGVRARYVIDEQLPDDIVVLPEADQIPPEYGGSPPPPPEPEKPPEVTEEKNRELEVELLMKEGMGEEWARRSVYGEDNGKTERNVEWLS
jgi:hypothetical protein